MYVDNICIEIVSLKQTTNCSYTHQCSINIKLSVTITASHTGDREGKCYIRNSQQRHTVSEVKINQLTLFLIYVWLNNSIIIFLIC